MKVGVSVGTIVAVSVGVFVAVSVGASVLAGVFVGVSVGTIVAVAVGVPVGVLVSDDRVVYERAEAAARAGLGDDAFERLRAEGRAMSMEEAIAYALGGGES